ncbi:hypothetical protein RI054_25g105200 [Pseudoscourfieldia marina]
MSNVPGTKCCIVELVLAWHDAAGPAAAAAAKKYYGAGVFVQSNVAYFWRRAFVVALIRKLVDARIVLRSVNLCVHDAGVRRAPLAAIRAARGRCDDTLDRYLEYLWITCSRRRLLAQPRDFKVQI